MHRSSGALLLAVVVSLSFGCKGDPKSPEYWDKALSGAKSKKDKVRVVADLRERAVATPAFLPMLHKELAEESAPEVKAGIVKVLAELKSPESVDPLVNALDFGSGDSSVASMNKDIATALGAIGDPKGVPTLVRLMKLRDPYTRIEAITALGVMRAKEAVDPLIELATDESGEPFISKKAIQALGEIGDGKAVPALIRMMFKERKGVSFYVESSFALYQLGQPAADALLPVLKGDDKALVTWAKENRILEPALFAKAAQVLGDLHDMRAESALLSKLAYPNEFLDVKLFVRMRMADALGRMRSTNAVKPLAGMLNEEEATAREEYIRALTRIGHRDAIPALQKSASTGSWDAREPAIIGLSMLGDDREIPVFTKLAAEETKLTAAECKENPDYTGCKDASALTQQHTTRMEELKKRLTAAGECKQDAACWVKKLDDADQGVRERAAFEVGRSGKPEYVTELMKRLEEKNLNTRVAIIQAVDWLIDDSKDAAKTAKASLTEIEKQLASERGKTEFVKVNEDLRRLAVKLRRTNV
jgi:HEAT repeat protein